VSRLNALYLDANVVMFNFVLVRFIMILMFSAHLAGVDKATDLIAVLIFF